MPDTTGSATPTSGSGTSGALPPAGSGSLRLSIAHWLERTFGRAAMPVAALAGGAVGGAIGTLLAGPFPGGLIGAVGGAFLGAKLFLAG